jgi:hypothetical protein
MNIFIDYIVSQIDIWMWVSLDHKQSTMSQMIITSNVCNVIVKTMFEYQNKKHLYKLTCL